MYTPTLHTFPATPVCPAYEALAVQFVNGIFYPVFKFEGRECFVVNSIRIQQEKTWRFYNAYQVYFLDGSQQFIPAARFNVESRKKRNRV